MRKIILFFATLVFITILPSCEKEEKKQSVDFSLLKQFDWQSIEKHEEKFLMDTTQIISYADTFLISFSDRTYNIRRQSTIISFVEGDEGWKFRINQTIYPFEGEYELDVYDDIIIFTETRDEKIGGGRWSIDPPRDTTIIYTYKGKILSLDSSFMTIEYGIDSVKLPNGEIIPPFPMKHIYNAVKK